MPDLLTVDPSTMSKADQKAALTTLLTTIRDTAKTAEDGGRALTADEMASISKSFEAAKKFKAALEAGEGFSQLMADLSSFAQGVDLVEPGEPAKAGSGGQPGKGASVGERFASADGFTGWMKQFPNGQIPESTKGITSPPVGYGGMKNLGIRVGGPGAKAVVGSGTGSAGDLIYPQHLGLVDQGLFQRPLTILDLLTPGQTGTNTIDYVVEQGFDNNANVVAEATASSGTSGTKPESGFELVQETANVRTIAHWIPATKNSLSDAGQIRTLIDGFLMYGLNEKLENEVISGDGTGQHLTGLKHVSGTQAQAWSATILTGGAGILETTRKAITKIQVVGRTQPTAFAFTPNDWETIELQRMKLNPQYDFGGRIAPSLHGLPVVVSQGLTDGEGWVGNWRFAVLWDREQASVQVSDSHADFFVRNLVAFLAELRAAFTVFRPSAFASIDLTA